MGSDLFNLQREIPEKFHDLYKLLRAGMDESEDVIDFVGSIDASTGDAIACDYNDTLLLMLFEKEAEIESIGSLLSALRERKSRLETQRERVRETLLGLLRISDRENISSAFGTSYRITVPGGKFEVEDEQAFAAANPGYTKVKVDLDRKRILDDLKEGVVIEGLKVTDRESIGVRR